MLKHAGEQVDVLTQVPRTQKQIAHAHLRRHADALGAERIVQQPGSSSSPLTRSPNARRSSASTRKPVRPSSI